MFPHIAPTYIIQIQLVIYLFSVQKKDQCCWSCIPCHQDSYVFNDTCVPCQLGYQPNIDYSDCIKIQAEHLTWDSPWSIVPLVFSALGITATIFIFTVFLRYNRYVSLFIALAIILSAFKGRSLTKLKRVLAVVLTDTQFIISFACVNK